MYGRQQSWMELLSILLISLLGELFKILNWKQSITNLQLPQILWSKTTSRTDMKCATHVPEHSKYHSMKLEPRRGTRALNY